MHADTVLQLALIPATGIAAVWVASALRLPSILMLLIFGFAAGPMLGWIQPDKLFGESLFPFVSLSVAIILFEGGLNLKLRDIRDARQAVIRLVLVGSLICWLLTTLLAAVVLDLNWTLSLLLGAVLIVTGPTVIIPLMKFIRPSGRVGAIAKWEGIVNDPIGAILAVLIFEVIAARYSHGGDGLALAYLFKGLLAGLCSGLAGAWLLVQILKRHLAPDHLHNPVTLMLVLLVFTVDNLVAKESGLLGVTLMGILLANQQQVQIRHIAEFKEELQSLLIPILFITLSARLNLAVLAELGWPALVFTLGMILIVRPASVWWSTAGTEIKPQERLFLGWMAPRGIVAAAVASVFSLELAALGVPGAGKLVSVVFLVIVGTVLIYGLTAGPLARGLGLAARDPRGILIIGAHHWARQIAGQLADAGVRVAMIDNNRDNIREAKLAGLNATHGSILSDHGLEDVDLSGISQMMALTANDEVNALAALHCAPLMGKRNTYQLAPKHLAANPQESVGHHLRGRVLGMPEARYEEVEHRVTLGHRFKVTGLTDTYDWDAFLKDHGNEVILLATFRDTGPVNWVSAGGPPPEHGDQVLALVPPASASADASP